MRQSAIGATAVQRPSQTAGSAGDVYRRVCDAAYSGHGSSGWGTARDPLVKTPARHSSYMRSSFLNDLMVSLTLGTVCGGAVAVVYQDPTIAVPFLAIAVAATPLVREARNASPRSLLWLGGAAIVAGGAAITYGWWFAPDGAINALGVLGGTALTALGVSIAFITAISQRSRNGSR